VIARFAELDYQETPMGPISLRRRLDPVLGVDVYEVKLGEEFLMSSSFTVAEVALATLGLAATDGQNLTVMNGGLGLGYTAHAALQDSRVTALTVVEALGAVVGWHEAGLLPVSAELSGDPRTRLVTDDFFALMRREPIETYDVLLLDIDHTPHYLLNDSHRDFYTVEGLARMKRHLSPGGVFALWSDEAPEPAFEQLLDQVFDETVGHIVEFDNALTGGTSINGVYVAR
jgi:spermidine synthase